MSNSLWSIAFGDYDLAVDRRTRIYRLRESKTGTLWASDLPLGWIEVEERETGTITRHNFGALSVFSVTEKSGATGKRILFGLDLFGIPIDIYVIAALREVQIIVEANRDSKTHSVHRFGLLPGLCAVPDDADSFLVEPIGVGRRNRYQDADTGIRRFWHPSEATMPFLGAVQKNSALVLITDSAYGSYEVEQTATSLSTTLLYDRDPERRRIDVRIITLPHGDPIAIARTYREKIIADGNHLTLRKKLRDAPNQESLLGAPWFSSPFDIPNAVWMTPPATEVSTDHFVLGANARVVPPPTSPEADRWETMDAEMQSIKDLAGQQIAAIGPDSSDWRNIGTIAHLPIEASLGSRSLALYACVYHDSVISPTWLHPNRPEALLDALLHLSPPAYDPSEATAEFIQQTSALLGPLHQLTFAAFLTGHRYLSADGLIEEATYSDKTRVVINRSSQEFVNEDLRLPAHGFFVRHSQLDAQTLTPTSWRLRRSYDGKPLEESADIRIQEFSAGEPI